MRCLAGQCELHGDHHPAKDGPGCFIVCLCLYDRLVTGLGPESFFGRGCQSLDGDTCGSGEVSGEESLDGVRTVNRTASWDWRILKFSVPA